MAPAVSLWNSVAKHRLNQFRRFDLLSRTEARKVIVMSEYPKPNLFSFATKELSQDAMICWLIEWADERFAEVDRELHDCGREFVRALLQEHDVTSVPDRIVTRIFQQDKSIDVLAEVGPHHVLLIEDKTGTTNHGGQLKKYYDHVINGRTRLGDISEENVYPSGSYLSFELDHSFQKSSRFKCVLALNMVFA